MSEIIYEQIAPNVRRAHVVQTPEELTQQAELTQAHSRLAQRDVLPPDASPAIATLWERLQALERLVAEGRVQRATRDRDVYQTR